MYKQFSYVEPLLTSERPFKKVIQRKKKFKYIKQDLNYYKEQNWINSWSKGKQFSKIPPLSSRRTAEFLKPGKRKKTKMERIIIILNRFFNKIEDSNKAKWIYISGKVLDNHVENKPYWEKFYEKLVYEYTRYSHPVYRETHNKEPFQMFDHKVLYAKKINTKNQY